MEALVVWNEAIRLVFVEVHCFPFSHFFLFLELLFSFLNHWVGKHLVHVVLAVVDTVVTFVERVLQAVVRTTQAGLRLGAEDGGALR
jgi:hypothetical protein